MLENLWFHGQFYFLLFLGTIVCLKQKKINFKPIADFHMTSKLEPENYQFI